MKRMPNAKHAVAFPILFLVFLAAPTVLRGAGVDYRGLWGTRYQAGPQINEIPRARKRSALTAVRHWSEVALDANAIDHSTSQYAHSALVNGYWLTNRHRGTHGRHAILVEAFDRRPVCLANG